MRRGGRLRRGRLSVIGYKSAVDENNNKTDETGVPLLVVGMAALVVLVDVGTDGGVGLEELEVVANEFVSGFGKGLDVGGCRAGIGGSEVVALGTVTGDMALVILDNKL